MSGSTQTSAFTYGSDGLRRKGVVTNADGTSTHTNYVYDGTMLVEQVIQHFTASGAAADTPTTITYLQGPSGPLYRKSSAVADPSWYVYDGLGSVVGEVDVNGNMTASKLFDVYGLTRSVTGTPTTRQGFVGGLGHESDDETGLIYMRARYYDPGVGRFVSEDGKRNGSNWFSYCNQSPTNNVDKSGNAPDPSQLIFSRMTQWMQMDQPFRNLVADDLEALAASLLASSEGAAAWAASFYAKGQAAFIQFNAAYAANDPRAGRYYAEMAGEFGMTQVGLRASALKAAQAGLFEAMAQILRSDG